MNKINKNKPFSVGRLTKIKKAIIDILSENHCLLSKAELINKLNSIKINPNRSTIYRELQFLTKSGIIIKNTISGIDYYEIPKDHHHHLVCLGCNRIDKVKITNQLEKQEKQIAKQNNFNIINHSLEFYGYCRKCQA
jgi:Fur family transcriptional regulator, ferric uptake regulator